MIREARLIFMVTKQKNNKWILLAIFCAILWGSASPIIKLGYELFSIDNSNIYHIFLFAGVRFLGAGFLTLLFSKFLADSNKVINTSIIFPVINISITQTIIQYVLLYIGLSKVSGAKGSILSSTNVFFTVLFSSLILRIEKLTIRKILACLLGFFGIILLNISKSFDLSFNLMGEGFVLFSAISNSVSVLLVKHYEKYDPVILTSYQFILGGIALTLIGLLGGATIKFSGIKNVILIFYLMLVSSLTYTIWNSLLRKNDPSQIVIFGSLIPIFGAFFHG